MQTDYEKTEYFKFNRITLNVLDELFGREHRSLSGR